MKKTWATAVMSIAVFVTACGAPESDSQDDPSAQRDPELERVTGLERSLLNFADSAVGTRAALAALDRSDVRTMEDVTHTLRTLRNAGYQISAVRAAQQEPSITVGTEIAAEAETLATTLTAKQRELFPLMRQTYAAFMSGQVAGTQTNYRAVGPRSRTLRAASPHFAAPETMMEAHMIVLRHARELRFERAEYVYALTGASYTIDIDSPPDGEIDG